MAAEVVWSQEPLLARREFDELAAEKGSGMVSIYLPTHRYGPGVEGDPIRLKNLLGEALHRAQELGHQEADTREKLEPARRLLGDTDFWQHQGDGLALFLTGEGGRLYRLPHTPEELAFVGDHYCLRPLLPAVSVGQLFYVLALSQKSVRLLCCTRGGARELDLHDIPESLADAVGYDWEEKSLQFHTGAPRTGGSQRSVVFHGQGGGTDESKDEIARFLRRIDDGLHKLLRNRSAPLVIAAVDYLIAIYHRVSHYPELVEGGLEGNPEHLRTEELHEGALEKVTPRLDAARQRQLKRLEDLTGTDRVATGIADVLPAAQDGRVDTLVLPTETPLWGTFDEESRKVDVHDGRQPGDEDLHDLALAYALSTGAEAYPADASRDSEVLIAGLLRY